MNWWEKQRQRRQVYLRRQLKELIQKLENIKKTL